jgi:hypothetical protein
MTSIEIECFQQPKRGHYVLVKFTDLYTPSLGRKIKIFSNTQHRCNAIEVD